MAIKKYILLAGILCLLASASYAQVGASFDVKDSSLIPSKRMPQHSEFLNGTYSFPAKPRNQLEVGLKLGMFAISGDLPAINPTWDLVFMFEKHLDMYFQLVWNICMEMVKDYIG
jgi:hypothetical protein